MEDIPRGIEILVKKASVDPAFRRLLLERRADAAREIDLELESSEIAMINAVPESQLESIISKTIVFPKQRKAFLGRVAALMIVALGTSTFGCGSEEESDPRVVPQGIRPDRIEMDEEGQSSPDERSPVEGVEPNRPAVERGKKDTQDSGLAPNDIRSSSPIIFNGIRPD